MSWTLTILVLANICMWSYYWREVCMLLIETGQKTFWWGWKGKKTISCVHIHWHVGKCISAPMVVKQIILGELFQLKRNMVTSNAPYSTCWANLVKTNLLVYKLFLKDQWIKSTMFFMYYIKTSLIILNFISSILINASVQYNLQIWVWKLRTYWL